MFFNEPRKLDSMLGPHAMQGAFSHTESAVLNVCIGSGFPTCLSLDRN